MVTSTLPVSLLDSIPIPALRRRPGASPADILLGDLLARAQAGDHDAFSQLYLLHKPRVFRTCLSIVHDYSLAEDLTQETFLQLHLKIATFRGDSKFTTWLHRMTVNIVLMRLRKRRVPVVSLDQMLTDTREEYVSREFGVRDKAQASVVDRLAIQRAVDTLAPGYRKFFLLHDVRGLEHPEIASMEGCTRGNSKAQLHRARRALRRILSAENVPRANPAQPAISSSATEAITEGSRLYV